MEFDDQQVDASQLDDRRGGRSTGMVAGAGVGGLGLIGVIVVVLINVLGGGTGADPVGGALGGGTQGAASDVATRCNTAGAIDKYEDCYVLKVFNEVNEVWAAELPAQGRTTYRAPKLVFFTSSVRTGGCGTASSQSGPFYCPADQRVYIDLGFMQQLLAQFRASGRYAEAYVVAHEVGHHLQNLLGVEAQVRKLQGQRPGQANALSVKTELQADCFAGAWGALANQRGNLKITKVEYDQALTAAAAVGDDRIQASSGGRVTPETWTHGSSQQRQEWFQNGFGTGTLASCNTFN